MKQFDKKKNRRNSNSKKWDRYQSRDILPMWVADMDFESPACIKSALRKYVDNGIFGYHSEPKELRDILKKYLKNKNIENILCDYVEHNNLEYEDIDGLLDECEEGLKSIKDNPDEHFEEKITQEDIDHATKYGYNPFK